MMPYERFRAWKECHDLALAVYRTTKAFPKEELYGLTSQARRAAFSAAANIAEGSAKRGRKEFRRYLDVSLGSLSELSYILRFARDLGVLDEAGWEYLDQARGRAGYMTWQLYKSLAES
jgi:four helix bundle protein